MSTTIDLGKLRFNWVGEWASNVQYESNDLVKHGGDVHVYIYGLKTSGHAVTESTYWALVQEGLSWKGEYTPSTAYKSHEVVHHANNAYVCILSEPAAGNAPPSATYWQLLATGIKFEGAYDNATVYQKDDIVYYGANTYICIVNSQGGNLPTDTTYWATFSHGLDWKGLYGNATAYKQSDVVSYGASVYIAKVDTVGNLPTDAAKWDPLTSGIKYTSAWDATKADYRISDVATFGGAAFIAVADNPTTGADPVTNSAQWDSLSSGVKWEGVWAIATVYQKDDIVSYGGNTFIALANSTGDNPETITASWQKMTAGVQWEGAYTNTTEYQKDDVVAHGGSTYIALSTTKGNAPSNTTYWGIMTAGLQWEGEYVAATHYEKHDVVAYGANTFIATAGTTGNHPTDTAYWSPMTSGIRAKGEWATATAYLPDDVVSYGGQTFKALVAHSSSVFATELAGASWVRFSAGLDWKGNWATATSYKVNDIVNSGGSVYVSTTDHISSSFAEDSANWASFANAGTDVGLTITSHGDILYRGASGPAALNAGTNGQVLTTQGPNADPVWKTSAGATIAKYLINS